MKRTSFRDGLLVRTVIVTLLAFVAVGVVTLGYTLHMARERASLESTTRLNQLLDTVESTLRVACFAKNRELAREVASGLLSNSVVLRVTIEEGGKALADQQRDSRAPIDAPLSPEALQRDIFSPFDDQELIGRIWLTPDPEAIERRIRTEVSSYTIQLASQLALIAGGIVVSLLIFVIRPIRSMSLALHRMDAAAGDRLPVPHGHAGTEIGYLAGDINDLASRLVQALEQEHTLRIEHEVGERKYQALFEKAESGIFIVDQDGSLTRWNPAFATLIDLDETHIFPAGQALTALPWETPDAVAGLIAAVRTSGLPESGDFVMRIGQDAPRWLNIALSPVGEGLLQGVAHDVSKLKAAEDEARRQAVTDPLTGLANRVGLETQLHETLADNRDGFTLLLVDLDKFRQVTEGIGVPAGDEILRATAGRLVASVKRQDRLARLTADTFAVVLGKPLGENAIAPIVDRVLSVLRLPFMVDGSPIRLSASIGITRFPDDGSDVPSLLRNAELAMDKAKLAGGNLAVFFDAQLARQAEQRRHLENDLRMAVRDQHFLLHFQPIVDLAAGRMAGAEALIRWRHPERGLVPPDHFIPLVEQSGLIDEIGLWVLDSACAQLAAWQAAGLDWYLSINVSGRQIPHGLPPEAVAAALARHGVEPARLALEITEGVLLDNVDAARHWLAAIQALNIRVYLDDFGTGYSSLSYLKRYPLDTLKIDRSFVQDMQPGSHEHSLVEAIIAMARSLGLKVVAEGVESAHHLAMLRAMGCHYAQGYFLSRPLPAEDFTHVAARIDTLLSLVEQPAG